MLLVDYSDVLARVNVTERGNRSHLLLGNGFSIACSEKFAYVSLYDRAVAAGLSPRAQAVFERLGTNNFEGVMRLLHDANWVGEIYGVIDHEGSELLADLEVVKTALVEAIAESHLEHSGLVGDARKARAAEFFAPYHNVFTTNYDLLAYWVVLSGEAEPVYWDGFGDDPEEPDAPHVVFAFHLGDHKGLFYVHGGLHLFLGEGGHISKHCWSKTGQHLTALIAEGMERGQYPMFVAEGKPMRKLEQILSSPYMSYAYDKLGRITNRLVVYGHSLGASDDHLRRAIAGIRNLKELCIGVHGEGERVQALAHAEAAVAAIAAVRQQLGLKPLNVIYYRSETAGVWDAAPAPVA
jgi:hypothetical protein